MTVGPSTHRRLTAMEIDVWVRRDLRSDGPSEVASAAASTPSRQDSSEAPSAGTPTDALRPANAGQGPRVRLASGRGRWLLVIDDAGAAEDQRLLDDLRGLLGVDQVRFGRWSDSAESGVAAEDWSERGIEWVLDFGGRSNDRPNDRPNNRSIDHPAVLTLPRLSELRESAPARKALWQALRPLLAAG